MSFSRDQFGSRSAGRNRHPPSRKYTDDSEIDLATKNSASLGILPELMNGIRRLLPQELPLNMYVRQVEYIENKCERLVGTLFMTTFRLVFAPENTPANNDYIVSRNRYISEYDIPLTSIYKIEVAPVDAHSGFKSFLNENQIQSETRTFTIVTRDFRRITFTKCSVTKSNTGGKHSAATITNMETYIAALRRHSRFQSIDQLYPYLAIYQNSTDRAVQDYRSSAPANARSLEDLTKDFTLSSDERIRSYLTYYDWKDDLQEASEQQWVVDRSKFNSVNVVRQDGPYVRLMPNNGDDAPRDLIWHWTHTSEAANDRLNLKAPQQQKHVLITVPGIGEATSLEPLRRATTESNFVSTTHYIRDQPFQRYNLSKFPCNLKRLQASYEKLIEICVLTPEDDDDKWWTKLGACKWLKYVSKSLHGAAFLARLLDHKHIQLTGSDTDNSCLMSSLIQVLLRPQCRTIRGFCELIVREWLIRGHKFRERFGQVLHDPNGHQAQESPVFLLFLDCVHQLHLQNPSAFEFTEYLLLELYRDVCYCYHHTFVFNNNSERLHAMTNCPKNLLVLSSFDFSMYLYADACQLLRNEASVFRSKSPATAHRPISSRAAVTFDSSPKRPVRTVYYNERPNSIALTSENPITSSLFTAAGEHFEYESIESPQSFAGGLHVDWRVVSLALWCKCYCRYDQAYRPTTYEEQLTSDVNHLKEKLQASVRRSQQTITLDTQQQIGHANSWHPQALDTRV